MSQPRNSKESTPDTTVETFWTMAKADIERSKWSNQTTAARLHHILLLVAVVAFVPMFFWPNKLLLFVAASLTWIAFVYSGFLMIFGAKSTVLNLWWSSTRRWMSGTSDDTMLVTIRIMGVAFVAFMLFAAFVIFRNGLTYVFQNFGR
jgi:hypothetical protein